MSSPRTALRLRAAVQDDSSMLLAWRNDPVSIASSRTGRAVTEAEHALWFPAALSSSRTRIWIGIVGDTPVGQVRIDLMSDGFAEVAVAVDPRCRGCGYGTTLVRAMQHELTDRGPIVRALLAWVHSSNAASLRLFGACGFTAEADDGDFVCLRWDGLHQTRT